MRFPAFVEELAGTLSVHSQFVLHGNIRDRFLMPPPPGSEGGKRTAPLLPVLWQALRANGYEAMVVYDPVDGLVAYPAEGAEAIERVLGNRALDRNPSLRRLRTHLARAVGVPVPPEVDGDNKQQPGPEQGDPGQSLPGAVPGPQPAAQAGPQARLAFVIDYAARITRVPGTLEEHERDFFLFCQKLAMSAKPQPGPPHRPAPLFNPVIWLVEGERDLPAWLAAGVERIRTIAVPTPDLGERMEAAALLADRVAPAIPMAGKTQTDHLKEFANRTDRMTLQAMLEIANLAVDRRLRLDQITDAVRIYKLGIEDNPWQRDSVKGQVRQGEEWIRSRVKGQEQAIAKTMDILKRAALNLSGAQATSTASRPRGVLFFAGPTGVGKTELAKQVAQVLFGDPDAFLRFDMSEFAQDHSADRLIGAPPGYVGFEAGGQLTGAIRRKPFQVILFDEIEKAHPLVLDKFLQILEDGRLTDGQGTTTHFSECVLIFTSNLGIIVHNQDGSRTQVVEPGTPYEVLEPKVREEIENHFKFRMGRPELLNRFGDNIVIFDFIGDAVAREIFDLQIENIERRLGSEHGLTLLIEQRAREQLLQICTKDKTQGGRGIGNRLESWLINPLARFVFDRDCAPGATVAISGFAKDTKGIIQVQAAVR